MTSTKKNLLLIFLFTSYFQCYSQQLLNPIKNATASSQIGLRSPSYVTDLKTIPEVQDGFFQSNSGVNNWIQLEFEKVFEITKVELYDINSFNVGVLNQNVYILGASDLKEFEGVTDVMEFKTRIKLSAFNEFLSTNNCYAGFKAKFLRVWDADAGGIRICEIKVYGKEVSSSSSSSNTNSSIPSGGGGLSTDKIDDAILKKDLNAISKLITENSSVFNQQHIDKALENNSIDIAKRISNATSLKPSQEVLVKLISTGKASVAMDLLASNVIVGNAGLLNAAISSHEVSLTNYLASRVKPNSQTFVLLAQNGDNDLFETLTDANPVPDNAAINIAIDKGNAKIVNLALNNGGNTTQALAYAISKDNVEMVKSIASKKGADPNKAISYAITKNNDQLFIDLLAIPTTNAATALDLAMKAKKYELALAAVETKNAKPTKHINAAILAGQEELVKKMVENGGDANIGMDTAIVNNKINLVEFFIANGALATPMRYLQQAAGNGYIEIVRLLVESGANASNGVEYAAYQNKENVMEYLLQNKADPNLGMAMAGRNGNVVILKLLIESGGTATKGIEQAIEANKYEAVKYLIENGAELTNPKLMSLAVGKNYNSIVMLLLENNFDVSIGDYANKAITTNNTQIFKALTAKGAKVTMNDAMQVAAGNGNTEIVKYLTENQYIVQDGVLPAIQKNKLEVLNFLISNGAIVNEDKYVNAAIANKAVEVVEAMHAVGADFKKADGLGNTPLHNATILNDVPMVEKLISIGVLLDAQNYKGNTALHLAADLTDRVPIIMLLAKAGATIKIKNNKGDTPKQVAPIGSKSRKALNELDNN